MPVIVFALGLLLSFSTFAENFRTRWVCATDPLSTSYSMIENQDNFELQVMHHNGVAFMPIHQGLITPSDLAEINEEARVLKKLGTRSVIFFKKSECSYDNEEWRCVHDGSVSMGQLKIDHLFLHLSGVRVITKSLDDRGHQLNFSFLLNGKSFMVPMEYSQGSCVFQSFDQESATK